MKNVILIYVRLLMLPSPVVDDSLVLWLEGEHGSNETQTKNGGSSGKVITADLTVLILLVIPLGRVKAHLSEATDEWNVLRLILRDSEFTMEIFVSSDTYLGSSPKLLQKHRAHQHYIAALLVLGC